VSKCHAVIWHRATNTSIICGLKKGHKTAHRFEWTDEKIKTGSFAYSAAGSIEQPASSEAQQ